jgi:hypothetical protein
MVPRSSYGSLPLSAPPEARRPWITGRTVSRILAGGALLGAASMGFVAMTKMRSPNDDTTELFEIIRGPILWSGAAEVPERNVFEGFNYEAPPWKGGDYELKNEADYSKIMVNSGANPDITEGVVDPYMQPHHLTVPEKVYTQDPPYDMNVVELGEKTLGRPFKPYVPEEPVMGVAYVDTPFDATLNSIPVENVLRDVDFPES